MQEITARQYYKAMALNALIQAYPEKTPSEHITDAAFYADRMLEEDGNGNSSE